MSTQQKKMSNKTNASCAAGNPSKLVGDYPLSSVLLVFGIGLGAGVALGCLLGGPIMPTPTLGQRTGRAAEQLGRQVLDAISSALPSSLAKHVAS